MFDSIGNLERYLLAASIILDIDQTLKTFKMMSW